MLYLEIALFCTKASAPIPSACHVTDVKYYNCRNAGCITTLLVFDYPEFQEFLFNTLHNKDLGLNSVDTKVDF